MLLKYLAGNITNIYNILKRYFNISRICCNSTLLCYLIFMWPFVPDKKKTFFHKNVSKVFSSADLDSHFTEKLKYYCYTHLADEREKIYDRNFKTTSMRHTSS